MHHSNRAMLRVAVIGAGKISEEHLAYLSGAAAVQLVGLCDLSPALVAYAVKRFGARRGYIDYQQMLSHSRPDVVHVLTPGHTHGLIVRACLEAGAHVIVEKPIAANHAEFMGMWECAQKRDKLLIEDHNYRFNKPFLRLERLVAEGRVGDVEDVEVRMAQPVRAPDSRYNDPNMPHPSHQAPCGVVNEYITHLAYLALRFLPRVDEITARWRNHGGGKLFKYDDLDATILGGTVHARLRFSARLGPDAFAVTVRGTRGWAETEFYQPYLRLVVPRGFGPFSSLVDHLANGVGFVRSAFVNFKNKTLQRNTYEGLHRFLKGTYASLRGAWPPPVTFDDMDQTIRLIDALVAERNRT